MKKKDELDKLADEAFNEQSENQNNINYSELLDCLCNLSDKDFKKLIKVAKMQRKTLAMIETYFGGENED